MPIYKTSVKKDGLQQYRVRINYIDRTGVARQLTRITYGAAEAKQLEAELMSAYSKSKEAPVSSMTLGELYAEYYITKKGEVRETSLAKINDNINASVKPYLFDIKLNKLNTAQLQKWKNILSEKGYKLKTLQNYYGELRALLNYAVKMDNLPKNPLLAVGNFKEVYFETPEDKLHYYTADQYLKYISVVKKMCEEKDTITEWGYYVFFSIAFYTGARKGEINALKWSDITGNTLNIRRSISQKIKGKITETPPKNKSSYRSLQIPLPLLKILNEHKKRQQADKNFTEDYRVCGGISYLPDASLDTHNIRYAALAELPHIRIHDFRHTHATLLINEGINIQEIARRLGHADVQQTWQTYPHLYPREEERAVSILNNIK